jgi:hypothetical protein
VEACGQCFIFCRIVRSLTKLEKFKISVHVRNAELGQDCSYWFDEQLSFSMSQTLVNMSKIVSKHGNTKPQTAQMMHLIKFETCFLFDLAPVTI